MSASPIAGRSFLLDGRERLGASYDEDADVLYLWRGAAPAEAISLTTEDGLVVRFDPATGEILGFTILDWAARWQAHEHIDFHLPPLGEHESEEEVGTTHRLLATAAV